MKEINDILNDLPQNDLTLYKEMGHSAIRKGKVEESIEWYKKGLSKARELRNKNGVTEFSHLLFTML